MSERASPAGAIDAEAARSALAWLIDAGLDVSVSAAPRGWLAAAPVSGAPAVQPEQAAPSPRQAVSAEPVVAAAALAGPAADAITSLAALDAAMMALDHPLRSAVPGAAQRLFEGAAGAALLILGEMPLAEGSDEARLLSAMLAAIGMDEAPLARVHILPWPMHGQRPARASDLAAFSPYAVRALTLMAPKLILALGSRAAALAEPNAAPATLRGRWLALAGAPMVASFAPTMLLRQPRLKAEAWNDLQRLQERLQQ
jgi:DNA polymerase